MELLKYIPVLVVIVTMVEGRRMVSQETIRHVSREHMKLLSREPQGPIMCARLAEEPYFKLELLLGQVWRIYYTWNINLENQCFDIRFRNATPLIVNRIHNDMSEYLTTEPNWNAATVLVKMGRSKHEMLLLADQQSVGRFQGVPNIINDGSAFRLTLVPLVNIHLKLIYGGKYLLMTDCQLGVTTLSAHRKNIPYRGEISGIAKGLDFGPGHQACLSDKHKDEMTQRK